MQLYNDYNSYLRAKYGCKVYRIGIDAGFSCPHRCAYCNARGSRATYADPRDSVRAQLEKRIRYLRETKDARKFIAYFQAFTNTNAPASKLKEIYDSVLPFEDIVGISIGTRPDAVDQEKLALIASYRDRYEAWVEYGLQSAHDKTLARIDRGHDYKTFLEAFTRARAAGILVSAHVILGLPDETKDDMVHTAMQLSDLKIDGIKIHLLHILKGSALENVYRQGKVKVLSQDEYVELACAFLEHLSPDIIIQRLTGQGSREDHLAPSWALDKTGTIKKIEEMLKERGTCQGTHAA